MGHHFSLLALLADGGFHSGEALGRRQGITRAAVWKQIQALMARGVPIHAVHGKGYRLDRGLELLDSGEILAGLPADIAAGLGDIEVLHEVDSTNLYLRRRSEAGGACPAVCLSESQASGRGRRGRRWVSPFGANIYLSILWRFEPMAHPLNGLGLATAIAVIRALACAGVAGIGVKWPNDIQVGGAKMGGILLETVGEAFGNQRVIVGVGLNVRMSAQAAGSIDQPWTDLQSIMPDPPGRNRVAALLIRELVSAFGQYQRDGLAAFREEWRRYDVLYRREVRVQTEEREIEGMSMGIDEQGCLLLQSGAELRHYPSGDVSVRPNTAGVPVIGG